MVNDFKPARIVAVSGPQGCGKGSMISEIEEIDFSTALNYFFIDTFKVSRTVQKEMGVSSLADIYADMSVMLQFQNKVLDVKRDSLYELQQIVGRDFIITERSFLDIAAYFELWCEKQMQAGNITENEFLDLTQKYAKKCYSYQKQFCDVNVIIPMMDCVEFENDQHRAGKDDIDRFYELLMKHVVESGTRCFFVTKETIKDRASQVINFLKGENV